MKAVIFYATREGQARRVADHVAECLRAQRFDADVFNVKDVRVSIEWNTYAAAFVVASVHLGHHEQELVQFARAHRAELENLNASFLSLTLSQAGAQDTAAPPDKRDAAAADAQRMIDVFVDDTGWRPAYALPVAGALAYSKYNFLVKFVMKAIARRAGGPTDTSRDYEFTDWDAVDRFTQEHSGSA
jgi:menaquinone-dependent protoporphyrinogen oxidase